MTPERDKHILNLLQSALARPPSQRAAYLDKACVGDESVRKAVESLIAADEGAGCFLEAPAVIPDPHDEDMPDVLPPFAVAGDRVTLPDTQMYRVVRTGSGGMGLILFCENPLAHPPAVVLKTYKDEFARNPPAVARFRWEAEAWVALGRHPNLVQAFHVFRHRGRYAISLEYVRGADLARRTLEVARTLDAALQICHGMEYAARCFERLGSVFVHRDLKPANLLASVDGVVKVTDFGLVKSIAAASTARMDPGSSGMAGAGTPPYMSPEQWAGTEDLDVRCDVYAFGCVLYEMLAGRPPFTAGSSEEYRDLHLREAPLPLLTFSPRVPWRVAQLVHRCLSKRRDDRFADFAAVRAEVEGLLCELGQPVRPAPAPAAPDPEELQRRALALITLGKPAAAVAVIDRDASWPRAEPAERSQLLECRGLARSRSGESTAAIQDLLAALRLRPGSTRGLLFHGEALLMAGLLDSARAALEEALRLDPWLVMAYVWLAHLHLLRGRLHEARSALHLAAGYAPGLAIVRAYRALWELRYDEASATQDPSVAYRAASEALELDPSCTMAYVVRAWLLIQNGEPEGAREDAQTARSLTPDDAYVPFAAALLSALEGDPDRAAQLAVRCQKLPALGVWERELRLLASQRVYIWRREHGDRTRDDLDP